MNTEAASSSFRSVWTDNDDEGEKVTSGVQCTCCLSTCNVSSALDPLNENKMDSIIDVLYDCLSIRLGSDANVCDVCRKKIRDVYKFKLDIIKCKTHLERLQVMMSELSPKIKEEYDEQDTMADENDEMDLPPSPLREDTLVWSDDDQNFIKPVKDQKKTAKIHKRLDSRLEKSNKKSTENDQSVFTHSEDEDQNVIKLPKTRMSLKLDRRLKSSTKTSRTVLKIKDVDKLNEILRSQKRADKSGKPQRAVLKIKDMEQLNGLFRLQKGRGGKRPVLKVNLKRPHSVLKLEDVDKLNDLLRSRNNKKDKRRIEVSGHYGNIQTEIKQERKYTLNKETLECEVCRQKCESLMQLERHMANHFPSFICENCGKGFGCQRRLKLHLISHVNDKFPCKVCGKILKNANAMNAHMKVHRDTPFIFMCPKCSERFKSYYQRQKHLISVHGEKDLRYKCKHCDSEFTLRSELRRHVRRSHLQEKNHICNECNAGFFSSHGLKAHMTKHTGERAHRCPVCQKSYPRMYTLREHMRIHNNDKRFVCGVCGRAFTQKCTLKGHMKVHEKYGGETAPAQAPSLPPSSEFPHFGVITTAASVGSL